MTEVFDPKELSNLYIAPSESHKGQNGKLLLIGGSHLFHAASIWALTIASKIVDMVFYASVPENNKIILDAKKEFRDGIVIRREDIESYIDEADCVLIGPGMVRSDSTEITNSKVQSTNLDEINTIEDEGLQTHALTKYIVEKYPKKRYVIDGGALQMMDKAWLLDLPHVILTPHKREFERLFGLSPTKEHVTQMAQEYSVVILLKGEEDIVSTGEETVVIKGGNSGMTKGGTGDVLAGLVAGFACKNDLFLSAKAGSYLNKKAGESLGKRVGNMFNATDLVSEIPLVMKSLLNTF